MIHSKLPSVGTNIFTVMSKMAADYNAINLSQGFPNFPIDKTLEELLIKNSSENSHQYTPMAGLLTLLEGIASVVERSYGRKVDPATELLVTAGATQGIFTTVQALVHHGDEVVIIDPAYDCYAPAVVLAGGKPVHVALKDDFSIDWHELREVIGHSTKLLFINTPHNPTGKVFTESDEQSLIQLMNDYPNLILVSDEVYEFITFGVKHRSANLHESLYNRAVIVSSFGKTFHITGWKTGYLVAPEYLMKEIKKVHQFLVFSVNSVAQKTLSDYIQNTQLQDLGSFYQQKRDFFLEKMKGSKFEWLNCEGSYFQTARYTAISDLPDTQFCEWLAKEIGVATIPLSPFSADRKDYKTIRFCFAKTDETLASAAERLCKI